MNAEIYEAVKERAAGKCEQCGVPFGSRPFSQAELDHAFGRARSETAATCWMLCLTCHSEKTQNTPSAAWWFAVFALHCQNHEYDEALKEALKKLVWLVTRADAGVRP